MSRQWWRIPTVGPYGTELGHVRLWAALRGGLQAVSAAALISLAAACSTAPLAPLAPTALEDQTYSPSIVTNRATEMGIASWYGPGFHGKLTANGERYDQNGMTAAHRTLPLGTWVRVRDLQTNRSVKVRVNDRGPYKDGRSIDLSYGAASALGIVERGTAPVEIQLLSTDYADWPTILYSIQIGAFSRRFVADKLGLSAADHGYRAYLKLVGDDSTLYGVRVGPFRQRTDAKRIARSLSRDGFDVQLVDEDPRTASYLLRNARKNEQTVN